MNRYEEYCKRFGHSFKKTLVPGDVCKQCGVTYCPVAYDHDEECAVCGWNGE